MQPTAEKAGDNPKIRKNKKLKRHLRKQRNVFDEKKVCALIADPLFFSFFSFVFSLTSTFPQAQIKARLEKMREEKQKQQEAAKGAQVAAAAGSALSRFVTRS